MKNFLLEIGTEEIPASYLNPACKQLNQKIEMLFNDNKISYQSLTPHLFTPRRISVFVSGVQEIQPDYEEEIKGPPVKIALDDQNNPTPALQAFLNKNEVSMDDLEKRTIGKKGEYFFAHKKIKGKNTITLLQENLREIILSLSFPKSMIWESSKVKFARPIRWICALFGKDIVSFSLADVSSNNKTRGHRYIGSDNLALIEASLEEYQGLLSQNGVYGDMNERKQQIENQIVDYEQENNWVIDRGVLDEVNNLVENPNATLAEFSETFLELPVEVIDTAIQKHQKYFPIKENEGNLVRKFLVIFNHQDPVSDAVKIGAEKIINARLEDAKFFWKEDIQKDLSLLVDRQNKAVFQEKLGTYGDKLNRIKKLFNYLDDEFQISEKYQFNSKDCEDAITYMKFDLISQMVYEFPNLQGVMGGYYLRVHGIREDVATAVSEQYYPRYSGDRIPKSNMGVILSLLEKIDNIVGGFVAEIAPTGSQDPYGLRRQAIGLLRICEEAHINIKISDWINISLNTFQCDQKLKNKLSQSIFEFMQDRLENLWKAEGFVFDVIDANRINFPNQTIQEAKSNLELLTELKQDWSDFNNLIQLVERLENITKNKDIKTNKVDETLFEEKIEKEVWNIYLKINESLLKLKNEKENFVKEYFNSFNSSIQTLFDEVMIMVEDQKVCQNRLLLLKQLLKLFYQCEIGAISKIVYS